MEHACDYLMIGAGMAADAAAKALHDNDPEASVAIIGDEPQPPYKRPPLSKGLWSETRPAGEAVDLNTAAKGAEVYSQRRAISLDANGHTVEDDQGDRWQYRRLLLATGATPRRLPLSEHERVIHFRTLEDFRRLQRLATPGAQIAVVGSGFIGSELTAALIKADCRVTMVFPDDNIGAERFPDSLAEFLSDYYRSKGVELRTGVKVIGGAAADTGVTLALSDSTELAADGVVAGLGVTPNIQLADEANLTVNDGIVVDEALRTSDPDIWAAGDAANFYSPALATHLRVEHENAALSMGYLAGSNMAGDRREYETLPFFYSDLFDLGYEAVGLIDNCMEIVEDWRDPYREGVVYYLDAGQVRGVLLWNVWGQTDAARELIASPDLFDMESLSGRIPSFM
jgi:NADPH-dependent 2,4-dienoyl-CoA reductase/sulfur reductase-like enzyme